MSFSDNEEEIIPPYICTSLSQEELIHSPYWKVLLSDGTTIYSKNGRRSWLELKSYLKENPLLSIQGLYFCFRRHLVTIHEGDGDYFFVHALKAEYGEETNQYFYVGGFRDGDVVHSKKYILPELFLFEEQIRPLYDLSVKRGLIKRENKNTCQ